VNVQAANGVLSYADSATGGLYLPSGTTAQRPASPATGQMRFNTTLGYAEFYALGNWWAVGATPTYAASYLTVAGGGGGGKGGGGGGGAGGLLTSTADLTPSTVYTITVGAGGAGSSTTATGTSGSNSLNTELSSITPTTPIYLYELDLSDIYPQIRYINTSGQPMQNGILRCHNNFNLFNLTNGSFDKGQIYWQNNYYYPFPMVAEGSFLFSKLASKPTKFVFIPSGTLCW